MSWRMSVGKEPGGLTARDEANGSRRVSPRHNMTKTARNEADTRNEPAIFPVMGRTFPSPSPLDDKSVQNDLDQLSRAPWFHRKVLSDEAYIRVYDVEGWLPPNIPIDFVFTPDWLNQFAFDDRDLSVSCDRTLAGVSRGFV